MSQIQKFHSIGFWDHIQGKLPYKSFKIFGRKIIRPIARAMIELINTPAADKSLIFLILLSLAGETKSAILSSTELRISMDITSPIARIIKSHSNTWIWKTQPASKVPMAKTRWILELGSSFNNRVSPSNAYLKLARRDQLLLDLSDIIGIENHGFNRKWNFLRR